MSKTSAMRCLLLFWLLAAAPAQAPVVAYFFPLGGPIAGGTQVSIFGNGFSGATAVRFGGVTAAFTAVSPNQVNAVAPANAPGPVSIEVVTALGTGTSPNTFRYFVPPVSYGAACGAITLSWSGFPIIGQSFQLVFVGMDLNPRLMIMGVSNQQYAGIQLPLNLSLLGWNGCFLQASAEVLASMGISAALPVSVPPNVSLVGARLYYQGLLLGASPRTTNALDVVIGQ